MNTCRRILAVLSLVALAVPALAQPKAAGETVKDPKPDAPEAPIATALKAALAGDFLAYLAAVHPDDTVTDEQRRQRERYEWKRFKVQAKWYLASEDPVSFVVVRRVPQGDTQMRVFVKDLKNADRMPVPVSLRKDGDAWKIETNSL
jgi:hypothetical protein